MTGYWLRKTMKISRLKLSFFRSLRKRYSLDCIEYVIIPNSSITPALLVAKKIYRTEYLVKKMKYDLKTLENCVFD